MNTQRTEPLPRREPPVPRPPAPEQVPTMPPPQLVPHAQLVPSTGREVLASLVASFVGLFAYLVCLGLLLSFGMIAVLGLAGSLGGGFTSLPSLGEWLAGSTEPVRVFVFGSAFLALWPAGLAAYVAYARLTRP
jgi:hypothetical protein